MPPFIEGIIHIMLNFWTHLASILDSNLQYFSLHFSNELFIKLFVLRRNFASARGDILKVRGELEEESRGRNVGRSQGGRIWEDGFGEEVMEK